jgi:hypothetical protein
MAAMVIACCGLGLLGCGGGGGSILQPPGPPPDPAVERVTSLRVGVGVGSDESSYRAGVQAAEQAARSLDRAEPRLVLIFENFTRDFDADRAVDAVAERFPRRLIFGGQVEWPIGRQWRDKPSVSVVVLAGPWQVRTAGVRDVRGREERAGRELIGALRLPSAQASGQGPGRFLMLFGEAVGERADLLLSGALWGAGRQNPMIGGGGVGEPGRGRQIIGGRQRRNAAWAAYVAGPFRLASVMVAPAPVGGDAIDAGTVRDTGALTVRYLINGLRTSTGEIPWRLLLAVQSAGQLAYIDRPAEMIAAGAERVDQAFHSESGTTRLAGWGGPSQLGPRPSDRMPDAELFAVAAMLIEPLPKATDSKIEPATTQEEGG